MDRYEDEYTASDAHYDERAAMTLIHKCPSCAQPVDFPTIEWEGAHRMEISPCCDEVCSRVLMCSSCSDNEAAHGADDCVACIADQVIADPRELDTCNDTLRDAITRELAERLRPFLRITQAA